MTKKALKACYILGYAGSFGQIVAQLHGAIAILRRRRAVPALCRQESYAIQAVLGQSVAKVLGADAGKETLEVNDVFDLGDRKWIVVGVMAAVGSTFDSEIWAKRQIVGEMFGKTSYTSFVLRTADARSRVPRRWPRTCAQLQEGGAARPETEYYAKLKETNEQFLLAIIFVAVIMAMGGVFGVMNTMFAAISQRTKDIGVLRHPRLARWQILVSFLLESLLDRPGRRPARLRSGYLFDGRTATSIVSSGAGRRQERGLASRRGCEHPGVGMLFALLMGSVGGLLPAWSATRLQLLDTLRR